MTRFKVFCANFSLLVVLVALCFGMMALLLPGYVSEGKVVGKAFVPAHQVEVIRNGHHRWHSVGDRWKLSLTDGSDTTWHFVTQADHDRMAIGSHQAFKTSSDLPVLALGLFFCAMLALLMTELSSKVQEADKKASRTRAAAVSLAK